jgi:hypothetical protein
MTFLQSVPMRAGRHALSVDNFNNYHAPAEERTLVVDWVEIAVPTLVGSPRVGQAAEVLVDGPEVHMAGTGLAMTWDEGARNKTSWHMWGVGCFAESVVFDHPGSYLLAARLRGNEREGVGSHTLVKLDGKTVDEFHVGDGWTTRETRLQAPGGASVLEVCYDNDDGGPRKRNLWMDEMRVARVGDAPPPAPSTPATPAPSTPTPAAGPPGATGTAPTPAGPGPLEAVGEARTPAPLLVALAALALAARLSRR